MNSLAIKRSHSVFCNLSRTSTDFPVQNSMLIPLLKPAGPHDRGLVFFTVWPSRRVPPSSKCMRADFPNGFQGIHTRPGGQWLRVGPTCPVPPPGEEVRSVPSVARAAAAGPGPGPAGSELSINQADPAVGLTQRHRCRRRLLEVGVGFRRGPVALL